jgi:hypothetical protein
MAGTLWRENLNIVVRRRASQNQFSLLFEEKGGKLMAGN